VTAPEARGTGLGRELMRRGIAEAGAVAIRIGAQAYLEAFYRELGFARVSEVYDEDGIPHVEMLRPA
jgi:ElaA protein